MPTHSVVSEPEASLADLRGDCMRMAPHWVVPPKTVTPRVAPSLIHGVRVPPASARLIEATEEYGA